MENRTQLIKAVWDSYYDSMYYQTLFTNVSKKWQAFDLLVRLLIAVTASGSAVAGWGMWNDPDFKELWAILAGAASLLSIAHATLNTTEKVNSYSKLSVSMSLLSHEYESLYQRLKVFPEFSINEEYENQIKLRKDFKDILELYLPDFFTTMKVRSSAQKELNKQLGVSS